MTCQERLLIIDDELDLLAGLKRLLGYELPGLEVDVCAEPGKVIDLVRHRPPDVVLLDVRMPEVDGLTFLTTLRKELPGLTCIMMTAHGTIELAVEAMKAGAYDFLTKPFETSELVHVLNKGLERSRLIQENRNLRLRAGQGDFQNLIGRSAPMRRLFGEIESAARSDYSVLIRGQSGTGKELVARALHTLSPRQKAPLVTVNCPAVPGHLLESELFGHERGAFTGADRQHRGMFVEANGGTLFLDEIADIPVDLQTKLLRALQDGVIRPLGANRTQTVDVRIVAATNQDLEAKLNDHSFREDLYYRLNVITLQTPSLTEIREDIPLLACHFVRLACRDLDLPIKSLAPEALLDLQQRPWPGNVRELQNVVRRAVIFSRSDLIEAMDLAQPMQMVGHTPQLTGLETTSGAGGQEVMPYKEAKERVIEQFTRKYVENLLVKTGGNISRSARLSGMRRASLQKIIRRFDIATDRFR